ncbi:glycosyltransferase family protein [Thermoflavifilum thermophilum]|uniref:Glycosyltransferase involved in cell wall bisynthesis n=1 Tax=Thermoflavifilum thermophilum TaxID=1393122 RepID=A0A1I7N9N8_9BACT|nr:hypothetical protein [Thermoflavifilum thermophilum]SFV31379.1 Glycosyltransferase involved in cell wall bisynthesis [Thermoflavifilum thermophilum]
MRVLILTTASLSTNPRLVKELYILHLQHSVQVIVFGIGGWADAVDEQFLEVFQQKQVIRLSANRKPLLPWLFSTVVQQFAIMLSSLLSDSLLLQALSHNKRSTLLIFFLLLKRKEFRFDLIICHTLGALYPGYILARKTGAKLAFDMEDYHPGEAIPTKRADAERRRREYLLKKMLPHCAYVSFAADGYVELTKKYITANIPQPVVVYNSFPSNEFTTPQPAQDKKIRFIWFSQTIGRGRGLELFFQAVRQAGVDYEITLIGQLNDRTFEAMLRQENHLTLLPPMPQQPLHHLLSQYDVGLSLELSCVDMNKNYALSNKLFAYLQAGLFVLATDTPGQKQFLQRFPMHHLLCKQEVEDMCKAIQIIASALSQIREQCLTRYHAARCIAWEHEQRKLQEAWNKILA